MICKSLRLLVPALVAAMLLVPEARAAVPGTITHQGRLFDEEGDAVTDMLDVTFTIYDAAEDGQAVWTETHLIAFDEGYFSVELGSTTAFDGVVFDGSTRWIGIQIDGDIEMTPRGVVGSVPYAILANDVSGHIHPDGVSINGYGEVIDGNGQWVGDPTGIEGPEGPAGPAGPAGPEGPAGPTGPEGPAGPTGPEGPAGPTGPQGPQGPTGAQGPEGPAGPQGPQGLQGDPGPIGPQGEQGIQGIQGATGPQGPSGIIASAFSSGFGNPPGTVNDFLGPILTVTVAAGQRVYVSANKYMGSTVGASGLALRVCYRLSGETDIVTVGGSMLSGQVPAGTRISWGVSAVISPPSAGTYNVGMCGSSFDAANWNSNEYGYTSALVFQP
jgi:hypothetical protein